MPGTRTIGRGIVRAAALAALAAVAVGASAASAKDRIYWANRDNNTLAFANLDEGFCVTVDIPFETAQPAAEFVSVGAA